MRITKREMPYESGYALTWSLTDGNAQLACAGFRKTGGFVEGSAVATERKPATSAITLAQECCFMSSGFMFRV